MRVELEPTDEVELRRRLIAGDRAAAETLVKRHFEPLYEFLYYRSGSDRAATEDAVQDTFVTALQGLARFDGRSSLHTWLCGIGRNKLREARRKRRPMALADVLEQSDAEIDAILATVQEQDLPDAVLERQETRDLVGATLSTLPPDYRKALLDKYVGGLSTAEIAGARGQGVKAAESTLVRARKAFVRVFELLAKKRGGLA
jgi:RNA polymerase sigma-70 factor (ECF subfamily)